MNSCCRGVGAKKNRDAVRFPVEFSILNFLQHYHLLSVSKNTVESMAIRANTREFDGAPEQRAPQ
jgi:hypothetical protein